MLEQTLAAVPLFVFMGILMEQAGLMERLFNSVQLMLSRTRGALYRGIVCVYNFCCGDRDCRGIGHHIGDHGGKNHEPLWL